MQIIFTIGFANNGVQQGAILKAAQRLRHARRLRHRFDGRAPVQEPTAMAIITSCSASERRLSI